MANIEETTRKVYDAYKDQNDSRQKYYLAIVVGVVCFALGWVCGAL